MIRALYHQPTEPPSCTDQLCAWFVSPSCVTLDKLLNFCKAFFLLFLIEVIFFSPSERSMGDKNVRCENIFTSCTYFKPSGSWGQCESKSPGDLAKWRVKSEPESMSLQAATYCQCCWSVDLALSSQPELRKPPQDLQINRMNWSLNWLLPELGLEVK